MAHRIAFIGAGNVAWHLAPALEDAGHSIIEVYSRDSKKALQLVNRLYQAECKTTLDFSTSQASIYFIAVADDAIAEVSQELALPSGSTVVHTSGAQSLSILGYTAADATGVFYPLQTFTQSKKIAFDEVPIFIEAEDKSTEKLLLNLAGGISKKIYTISSEDRKALHVAAVFACNFTNHCLTLATSILQDKHLDFQLLRPLIQETISKALEIAPHEVQTGPAKRQDVETLDKHMAFLQNKPALAELYRHLSQHIIDFY